MFEFTAAHGSAPLGMHAIVTNLDTCQWVRVRINDRGPVVAGRILDLSYAAARHVGMINAGLARVRIEFLPETVPATPFIVQAGAYTDHSNAVRAQRTLAARYSQVWIAITQEGAQTFYRVRLGTFPSRADAEQAARQVQALGYTTSIFLLSEPPEPPQRAVDRF
jgi:rare lipoprotein A